VRVEVPEEAVSNIWASSLRFSIWKLFYSIILIIKAEDHSLPFKLMKIVLFPHLFVMFCTAYRYRICIADPEFRIYEVSFISLADSTSALAEMIVASETRFWMAADWRFFWTSGGRMTST
jgi:hypothetical protein